MAVVDPGPLLEHAAWLRSNRAATAMIEAFAYRGASKAGLVEYLKARERVVTEALAQVEEHDKWVLTQERGAIRKLLLALG